jgi:DNA-binding NtrC family response regulator
MKESPRTETAATGNAIVLSVGADDVDGVSLEGIFHESGWRGYTNSEWTLIERATLASAFSVLREVPIPIVLCDCDRMPDTRQKMLERISVFLDPPLVILTARLADERLWAEALNLGAYDVLAKPFDATETIRSLSLAWQHWQDRRSGYYSQTKERRSGGFHMGFYRRGIA